MLKNQLLTIIEFLHHLSSPHCFIRGDGGGLKKNIEDLGDFYGKFLISY
jgi:hypothetical protein